MTCLDFQNRLQELLDHRQRELPAELSNHTTHCLTCRSTWEQQLDLHDTVTRCWASQPAVHLADRVLQQRQNERALQSAMFADTAKLPAPIISLRRHAPLTRLTALLMSALTLLMAAGIGWRISGNVGFARRQNLSSTAIAAMPKASQDFGKDRRLDALLHDARDAYVALASQAWKQVSAADMLLPPANFPIPLEQTPATQSVPELLTPLGEGLREAVDSWLQQVFNNQDSST